MQLALLLLSLALLVSHALGQTVASAFSSAYTVSTIGMPTSPPGNVPGPLGGLDFDPSDPTYNTILIGSDADDGGGGIYRLTVSRDPTTHHITAITGSSSYASSPYVDGGVVVAPNGAILYTNYPFNKVGQIGPNSNAQTALTDLTPLGVYASVGALNFVPASFGSSGGQLKVVSYSGSTLYTLPYTVDSNGIYQFSSATLDVDFSQAAIEFLETGATVGGSVLHNTARYLQPSQQSGPEGIVFVKAGSPLITVDSMMILFYGSGNVVLYQVDSNGSPILSSAQEFLQNIAGAEGGTIDPVTGDFLFTTFDGNNVLVLVSGFVPPPAPPSTAECGQNCASSTVSSSCAKVGVVSTMSSCASLSFSDSSSNCN